uniref:Metal-nicotianamine transporter n=1 Tax=Oryza rufipogon TaxID=4529 RepID=A0A0E0PJL4_ORYRU
MDAMIGDPMSATSVEAVFEKQPSPEFRELVTPRAMAVAVVLSVVICFVGMRIQMTAGIVPALNMPASILSFFLLKWLIRLLQSCGFPMLPFTRQENMFLLTCIITCLNLALTSGFATNIIGMTSTVARSLADDPDPRDIMDHVPIGKWIVYLFLVGMTGVLINVPFNQWFYTAGDDCGFQHFPTFGLGLYKHRFYFDFSATYIGLGMICPHIVNFGLFFGAIISWGFLYPFLETKRGQWYQTDSPTSLNGQNGYKVFISVTLIITDGMINFLTLITTASINFYQLRKEHDLGLANYFKKHPSLNYDDRKRIEVFLANRIPIPVPVAAYITCAAISTIAIPAMFNQIKFYHLAVLYMVIPVVTFCNTYATGLTDWSVAPTYAKFTTFVFAAWIAKPGAVVASLLASGVIVAALHISSQAMQDLKSGHMTLTSPRAMVTGQIFGVAVGSILCPCVFLAFQSTTKPNAPVGSKQSDYPCPFAGLYRAIGVIGTGGVKELPKHCMTFCVVAFCVTVIIDAVVLVSQKRGWSIHRYIPSMTVIALPFFAGSYFTIDMCVGSLLLLAWTRMNAKSAEMLSSAVAAGLICGEGLFTLPSALLNMFKVQPPMCMKFLSGGEEVEAADSFLNNLGTSRT